MMPPEYILNIAKETWEGVKAIVEALGKESRRSERRCRRKQVTETEDAVAKDKDCEKHTYNISSTKFFVTICH